MAHYKKFLITLGIGAGALVAEFVLHRPDWAYGLILITGTLVALSMLKEMIATLREGRYGVDILAITAIVATLSVGEYWASLMILIMLTGGDSLEDYAGKQASRELKGLLERSPQKAHQIVKDELREVSVEDIQIGDQLIIKPGEIVPVDGRIVKGISSFDESSLSGESAPVEKKPNDLVMSGSYNGDSLVYLEAMERSENSHYQRIVHLVKESQEKPAHFVRLADRYAVPFTLIAYVIGGIAWWVSKDPVRFAEVLVVASPCPLILAAPIALVAGMSRSSRHGVILKTGTAVEKLAAAKTVAFDKTGTITTGRLQVVQIETMDGIDEADFIHYAASAEANSTHVLARSLTSYAQKKQMNFSLADHVKELPGLGISAVVDGHAVKVGRASFAGFPEETAQETKVFVSIDGKPAGMIRFEDQIRQEAPSTIHELIANGFESVYMLTGDKQATADAIAHKVGITQVRAECLPEDKLTFLKELPKNQRPVLMVGDGINDAPALAVADIGVAMGATGATAASESADAVILKDDLKKVAEVVAISKDTMRIARQSVLIGIFICIGLMVLASTGLIPALLGAALQEVVDTVSILSALRAKNDQKKNPFSPRHYGQAANKI